MRVRPPDGNLRAAPLPELQLPHSRHSRMVRGAPFFRMCEEQGTANAVTIVESMEWPDTARGSLRARHRLHPQTGRQHHLRVHMAALGAPINNDTLYPELDATALHSAGLAGDWHAPLEVYSRPFQLLARALSFHNPFSGKWRHLESTLRLV